MKQPYETPTLVKADNLADITANDFLSPAFDHFFGPGSGHGGGGGDGKEEEEKKEDEKEE